MGRFEVMQPTTCEFSDSVVAKRKLAPALSECWIVAIAMARYSGSPEVKAILLAVEPGHPRLRFRTPAPLRATRLL